MGLINFFSHEFIDVIEWLQSDEETMVYRFPRYRNEIKYGAKLTVRQGQTAILVNEGKIADIFPPGIYELKTANLPILSTLQHWDHGFESPFKAEVYFFNTTQFLNQKWGTKQPVIVNDKQFGLVRLRAFGHYTLRVDDAEVLLRQLVGTDGNFEIHEVSEELTNTLATHFPEVLMNAGIGVIELPTRYSELSQALKKQLAPICQQYGLSMGNVYIESISLPENVQKMLDEKTNLTILGDDLSDYTQLQAAKGLSNDSGNSMASAGVGMAMGMQMGKQMTQNMQNDDKNAVDVPPPLPKSYYLMLNGERIGPMSVSDVYDKLDNGEASAHTLIWRKGLQSWQSIENLSEIDLSHLPPPAPVHNELP